MPADTLTVTLPAALAEEVRAAAEARGVSPEEYVREELAESVALPDPADDLSWEEDLRRLEEPGENTPLEQAFAEIRARLAARVASPRK